MREIDYEALDDIYGWQKYNDAFRNLSDTLVPGEGDNAIAFIMGEAPGAQEEIRRRPFVGPAGRVLRDLMEMVGLFANPFGTKPDITGVPNCWLTNVVKFRPPRNRNPTDAEIKAARPYIRQEWIAVGRPQLIIPVGGIALKAFTGKSQSILRAAGKLHKAVSRDGLPLGVWPMVHPSFGLRNPSVQPLLEKDWEKLGEWLANHSR